MIWKGISLLALFNLASFGVNGFAGPKIVQWGRQQQQQQQQQGARLAVNNNHEHVVRRAPGENHNEKRRGGGALHTRALTSVYSAVTAATLLTAATYSTPATAYYDKNYPQELVVVDGDLDGRNLRKEQVLEKEVGRVSALTLGPQYKPISAVLWGAALWLLSGSRSNPLATPLANLLYDETKEKWLQDRNDGLFASLPLPLLLVLSAVFVGMGWGADAAVVLAADGDRNISLQLAGVATISGASLELGRLASGQKAPTRDEADRDDLLESEFAEFARRRLLPGGNCHRNEVVRAFRRYFAKYRQPDSEEYPLADLEVERLLKAWTKTQMSDVERTSSGFYYGVQINKDADVFV